MSPHFVCRSCRLNVLFRSQAASIRSVRTTHREASNAATVQTWNESSSDGPRPITHVNAAPIGRYSRQPVRQAKEMLQLLMADEPPPANARVYPTTPQRLPYTEAVTAVIDGITSKTPGGNDDGLIWTQLQDLARIVQDSNIKVLHYKRRRLADDCSAFALRQTARWVAATRAPTSLEQEPTASPAPSHVFAVLQSAGISLDLVWPTALWLMASGLLEREVALKGRTSDHIAELMKVWHICLTAKAGSGSFLDDWSFLPTKVDHRTKPMSPELALAKCMNRPMTQHKSNEWSEYTGALLLTLDILECLSPSVTGPYRSFMTFFNQVEFNHHPPACAPASLRVKLESESGQIRDRYMQVAQRFHLVLTIEKEEPQETDHAGVNPATSLTGHGDYAEAEGLPTLTNSGLSTQSRHGHRLEKTGLQNLARAIDQQNIALADSVLRQVLHAMHNRPELVLDNKIFESLILTYFSLRNPQKALGVWKVFLQAGRQATVRTYSALMHGCQKIHDLNGSETFWHRMRQSGIQPDAKAWGSRIWALLRGGRIQSGLDAMAEMSSEWLRAAQHACDQAWASSKGNRTSKAPKIPASKLIAAFQGDVNHVPRPNSVIVNSAVAALAGKNSGQAHIGKVISWGRAFDIEPDQVIYNALLNLCLKTGEISEAVALLSRMQQKGIEADSTTWTVLLTNLVEDGSLDGLTPQDQQAKVLEFMTAVEKSSPRGIREKGYAVVIDRLLKKYENPEAAQAVLLRMLEKGLQPTPHIYTILITALFDRKPSPDFAAIENLWSDIQAQNGGRGATLDHIFYERMVEGYAANHRTVGLQPAFSFMNHVLDTGRKPSWVAMTAIVRALAERQDWNRLNQLVHDVTVWEDRAGPTGMHVGENEYHRRDFWRSVLATEAMGNNINSLPAVKV